MMAAKFGQHRPVSVAEVAENDAASVRSIWELAQSINNYVKHVGHWQMIQHIYVPPVESVDSSEDEEVLLYLGKFYWHPMYDAARFWANGELTAGAEADADYTEFRIVLSNNLYVGPAHYDSSRLDIFGETTFRIGTDLPANQTNTFVVNRPSKYASCYGLLTAKNIETVSVPRAKLYMLNVQEIIS